VPTPDADWGGNLTAIACLAWQAKFEGAHSISAVLTSQWQLQIYQLDLSKQGRTGNENDKTQIGDSGKATKHAAQAQIHTVRVACQVQSKGTPTC